MAKNDVEVEIKLVLTKGEFEKVGKKVRETATFVKTSEQADDYYNPPHKNFVRDLPFEWLSIRKRGGKTILSYKHYYPEDALVTTHCDEFETEVGDCTRLEKIFAALDLKKLVTVEKYREVFVFQDKFEIALDTVKELGYFIEIEALEDFGGVDETRRQLLEFAKVLGIESIKLSPRGYAFLMLEKAGLVKHLPDIIEG